MHRCNLNVDESSSSFLVGHIVYAISRVSGLVNRQQFPCSLVHLSEFPLAHFKNGLEYLIRGIAQFIYSLDEISAAEFGFKRFSCFYEVLFSSRFSFHFCLFDNVRFLYSQVFAFFLFFKCSDAFPIVQFCSFRGFSFPFFHLFQYQNPYLYLGYRF